MVWSFIPKRKNLAHYQKYTKTSNLEKRFYLKWVEPLLWKRKNSYLDVSK